MADATQIMYKHRELIALLLRDQGIKSGHWALSINFAFGAGAVAHQKDEAPSPAAFLTITEIGLQKADAAGPGTVDAAALSSAPPH